ncbi:hypothetical protein [Kocuria sp.]|uniref:hypothetical protein n=1 Tax=Kocuria sp. TaxID=1871328 RepID=UPI0026DF09F7|nr:hypothetical protein [Kocuria sp.]MDO5617265.1 hypothetical protein [Kocuria sp.]
MTDEDWELRVCVQCELPNIAKRALVMSEDMSVSRVYYCPVHGPLSIAVVVDMRAIRARRRGQQ